METAWPADLTVTKRDGTSPVLSCGAVVWRFRGELRLTIIAKASFDLVHDAKLRLRLPEELVRRDYHLDNNPLRSVREVNDLAPFRPRADVTLVGHAYAPAGVPTTGATVRLALYRDTKVIDRSLHVYGDTDSAGSLRPFERMPLWPERALATVDNPIGSRSPNVVDPRDTTRAGSFAPISRLWPPRARLLKGAAAPQLEALCEIPESLDWSYFQSAPPEQQISYLRGDEWIVLDGVHPTLPRIKSQLPGLRGRALVLAPEEGEGRTRTLELCCDSLAIDGDQMTASVTFRGSIPLESLEALAHLRVMVGMEMAGEPIVWPTHQALASSTRIAQVGPAARENLGDTKTLTNHVLPEQRAAVPFVAPDGGTSPQPLGLLDEPLEDDDSAGTTEVYEPSVAASFREGMGVPFVAAKPTDSAPYAIIEPSDLDGTFTLSAEESRALETAAHAARATHPLGFSPSMESELSSTMNLSDSEMESARIASGQKGPPPPTPSFATAPFSSLPSSQTPLAPSPPAAQSASPFPLPPRSLSPSSPLPAQPFSAHMLPGQALPLPPFRPPPSGSGVKAAGPIIDEDSSVFTSVLSPEEAAAALQGKAPALPFAQPSQVVGSGRGALSGDGGSSTDGSGKPGKIA